MDRVEQGRLGELAAAKWFTERGLLVLWPMGETVYDFAVDDGTRIRRVQVKSSGSFDDRGRMRFCLRRRMNGKLQVYLDGEVDLFALYNAVEDEVRILSSEDLNGRKNIFWEDGNA